MNAQTAKQIQVPSHLSEKDICALAEAAAARLKAGAVLGMLSDTIYGFLTEATVEGAAKLTKIRGREEGKPYLCVVPDKRVLASLVDTSNRKQAVRWIEKWMPGRNTLIFRKRKGVSYPPGNTIAVRIPSEQDNRFFALVVQAYGGPLLAPSLNRAGEKPLSEPKQILEIFGDKISALYVQGAPPILEPSALYDLSHIMSEEDEPLRLR